MKLTSFDNIYHIHQQSNVKRWFIILALICLVTLFLPWTQNIKVKGTVTTLYQDQRPQQLNSPIPGKIIKWYVKNGDFVQIAGATYRATGEREKRGTRLLRS